jgi:hypothetical protein
MDLPLEGDGFEPSVPLQIDAFEASFFAVPPEDRRGPERDRIESSERRGSN